ncbi:unnamed protein product, partial [Rhizoctonia solani]
MMAESTSSQHTGEESWTGLERALQSLHITAQICPPLHSAIDDLKSWLHTFKKAARSRKDYDKLSTGLTAMVELLNRQLPNSASDEIEGIIANITEKITAEIQSIDERRVGSKTHRLQEASRDKDDIIRRYRWIEQLFCQLQGKAIMSSWNVASKHLINAQLESLRPVKLAAFDSEILMDIGRRSCTENTRTKILSDSMAWADNPAGAKIYWMNGMASTGKTTIAYSLCKLLTATRQLAASFF